NAPVQARAGATGQTGEVWARVYLERIGHRILATGFRHGRAEIDIVSEEGSVLVFTEVKACAGGVEDTPSARLSAAQRQRIGLAAEGFMAERGMDDRPCRFDVIEVLPGRSRVPRLRHFRGAFMLDG
ncbi:MAG: YraN family protein, partial [Armatimonadetes bacterium]|nr:YraN family protein [Armatimonadota bacterium]